MSALETLRATAAEAQKWMHTYQSQSEEVINRVTKERDEAIEMSEEKDKLLEARNTAMEAKDAELADMRAQLLAKDKELQNALDQSMKAEEDVREREAEVEDLKAQVSSQREEIEEAHYRCKKAEKDAEKQQTAWQIELDACAEQTAEASHTRQLAINLAERLAQRLIGLKEVKNFGIDLHRRTQKASAKGLKSLVLKEHIELAALESSPELMRLLEGVMCGKSYYEHRNAFWVKKKLLEALTSAANLEWTFNEQSEGETKFRAWISTAQSVLQESDASEFEVRLFTTALHEIRAQLQGSADFEKDFPAQAKILVLKLVRLLSLLFDVRDATGEVVDMISADGTVNGVLEEWVKEVEEIFLLTMKYGNKVRLNINPLHTQWIQQDEPYDKIRMNIKDLSESKETASKMIATFPAIVQYAPDMPDGSTCEPVLFSGSTIFPALEPPVIEVEEKVTRTERASTPDNAEQPVQQLGSNTGGASTQDNAEQPDQTPGTHTENASKSDHAEQPVQSPGSSKRKSQSEDVIEHPSSKKLKTGKEPDFLSEQSSPSPTGSHITTTSTRNTNHDDGPLVEEQLSNGELGESQQRSGSSSSRSAKPKRQAPKMTSHRILSGLQEPALLGQDLSAGDAPGTSPSTTVPENELSPTVGSLATLTAQEAPQEAVASVSSTSIEANTPPRQEELRTAADSSPGPTSSSTSAHAPSRRIGSSAKPSSGPKCRSPDVVHDDGPLQKRQRPTEKSDEDLKKTRRAPKPLVNNDIPSPAPAIPAAEVSPAVAASSSAPKFATSAAAQAPATAQSLEAVRSAHNELQRILGLPTDDEQESEESDRSRDANDPNSSPLSDGKTASPAQSQDGRPPASASDTERQAASPSPSQDGTASVSASDTAADNAAPSKAKSKSSAGIKKGTKKSADFVITTPGGRIVHRAAASQSDGQRCLEEYKKQHGEYPVGFKNGEFKSTNLVALATAHPSSAQPSTQPSTQASTQPPTSGRILRSASSGGVRIKYGK